MAAQGEYLDLIEFNLVLMELFKCVRHCFSTLSHPNCLFSPSDLADAVDLARELRQLGDTLYWTYKLLEILIQNYKTVTKFK